MIKTFLRRIILSEILLYILASQLPLLQTVLKTPDVLGNASSYRHFEDSVVKFAFIHKVSSNLISMLMFTKT